MRFFTQDVAIAEEEYAQLAGAARAGYEKHLTEIELPPEVREVAEMHLVDDGLVSRLRQSDNPALLELHLRCGWDGPGYFDLCLTYFSPEITDEDLTTLTIVAENARSSVQYGMTDAWVHEFDLCPDGRLRHSIGFHWPTGMIGIEIVCREIAVERVPRDSRNLPPYEERFRVERFGASSL